MPASQNTERLEIDPDHLDATSLERLGRHDVAKLPVPDWNDLPEADEIARRIGAQPVSELERNHRRAHNLGSLKFDARP